ncbi:Rim8p NDAI_0D02830 [Naumovozyma dairenensis CBS 421]|uniref:pH-response regulator protein palF/RIM8 n=1 Tax=Naumovozyma dairenensis (strain ATCC 10597 / BCRC 20456 / CBS 421 / NBRC 0211 / NRRL Y-12639) TaxID=1071378 RepID=G0W9Y6_NAUDC|nr:hypothetical protein NDAI_0D02830 [Naumovozyma dairenensis CBS 421]CCD24597.1 hypothetical protein NDAI_0D02830 [Naumovozyma dairenensis CBS 421]
MALLDILKKSKSSNCKIKNGANVVYHHTHSHSGLLSGNNVKLFYIKLDEPHRLWKPNEYIKGEVILDIKKDLTNIALRFSLISEIKVKLKSTGPTTNKKIEKLVEKSSFLYGSEGIQQETNNNAIPHADPINGLTKGEHRFPFRIKIPNGKHIFSSIKFEKGSIDYYLQCSLESLGINQHEKPISRCEQGFSVLVPLDVTNLPDIKTKTVVLQSYSMLSHRNGSQSNKLLTPEDASSSFTKFTNHSTNSKSSKSSSSSKVSKSSKELSLKTNEQQSHLNPNKIDKTVQISVDIGKSGYILGDLIPIHIAIQHYKECHHSAGLILTLVRICRIGNQNTSMETFRKDICQNIAPLYIDPETLQSNSTLYLKVPLDTLSTFTSFNKFFSFQYYVEVMVNLSRKNMVYTESNRIIGSGADDDDDSNGFIFNGNNNNNDNNNASTSNGNNNNGNTIRNKVTQGVENNINHIQKKVLKIVTQTENGKNNGSDNILNNQNDIESNIIYKDMVNVEKLKRLRNVTGMSIEIVVGTTKQPTQNITTQSTEASNLQTSTRNEYSSETNDLSESIVCHCHHSINGTQIPDWDVNEWLTSPMIDNPAPEYTPKEGTNEANLEDKQELERLRLQELESQPDDY